MEKKNIPLGDLHFGRQTRLVETETEKYILKPRSYKTEEAFGAFCERLTGLGLCAFSRPVRAISIGEDHHTEAIEENSITDYNGVSLYYKRAGILLFFSYLLFSSDLHGENIIAAGDMPIAVDLETLLTGKKSRSSRLYNLSLSVMCSHLLCNFAEKDGIAVDVSGFSGVTSDGKNIPHTSDGKVFIWQREQELTGGFTEAYKFCLSHKDEVEELIHLFDDCEFRQILRPTGTYAAISSYLKKISADKREEKAYELLSRAYKNDIDNDRINKAYRVLAEEVRAVLADEIPLFHTTGNGCDLLLRGETVLQGYLELSGVQYSIERLNFLSESDLEAQCKIISLAIAASTPVEYSKKININTNALAAGEISGAIVSECAVDKLPSLFCSLGAGRGGLAFTSAGFGLYSGLSGVLCAYAALYRKTEKSVYSDMLRKCFERIVENVLKADSEIPLTNDTSSLGDGIIGIASALLHAYELTEKSEFKESASSILSRLVISEGLNNTDHLNGIGALPYLLLKSGTKNKTLANGLVKSFENAEPYTCGAAHGAAGLSLGLGALAVLTGNSELVRSALDIVKWENSEYSEADCNWYDLRDRTKKGFMSGWCSGAPGIGMARLALLGITHDSYLKELCIRDIERAKTFLLKETQSKRDSLCCGTSARLMAASRLGIGIDQTFAELARAEKEQRIRLFSPASTRNIDISLMQGYAGIAYALCMYGDTLGGGMLI